MNLKRRKFIKQNLALAGCMASGFNVLSAHAANLDGYKALVCIYLAGGNDSFNMFVPSSVSEHADYADARQFLAVPRDQLLPTDSDYGFHPRMPNAQALYGQGSLAVLANVGPLIRPVTRQQYLDQARDIPPQLFSHNDQTGLWMTAYASQPTSQGWAGRMMDLLYPNPASTPRPSPSISIGGNNLWQTGNTVRFYDMGREQAERLDLAYHAGPFMLSDAYAEASQLGRSSSKKMVAEHALIQDHAIEYSSLVNGALAHAPTGFTVPFGSGGLQAQLQMVARLIAVRDRLDSNVQRQVFFVRLGGWDTHSNQLDGGPEGHPSLLAQLDQSLHQFNSALGDLGVQNEVTTFTATEFGRSLTPNSTGTDHGWGGHNMIMGGAVSGNSIYGIMPELANNSDDTVENNRIIPSSSVDQYSATLARWFGLNASELNSVFPNLGNFVSSDLGFMG